MRTFIHLLRRSLGAFWGWLSRIEIDGPHPRHERYQWNEEERLDQLKDRIRYQTDRYVSGRSWP